MTFELQRTGGDAQIVAGGRLTTSQAGRLRQLLLEAFEGASRVELSLHQVQEADLSFLQLLCAAHRTAVGRGIAFRVSVPESAEPVLRLIRESGAERGVGGPAGCPWPGLSATGSCAQPKDCSGDDDGTA